MTFLEALYGSQYNEIQQQEKDGNKGRLNGNLFLSAIVILFFVVIIIAITWLPGFENSLNNSIINVFGSMSGRSAGKLLAIPLFVIIYFIINKTIGSEDNFKSKIVSFLQYFDKIKKKANAIFLIPFFILLAIVFGLAMFKL